jgi:tryptophan synthase alpha chain
MSRLDLRFAALKQAKRSGLIPFFTCGDPFAVDGAEAQLMHALVQGGADVLELGMPFSDPVADGPVIEKASERAIARGVELHGVLRTVAEFRRTDALTPIVLMGYVNPIEQYGTAKFFADAGRAGADAVLLVDCPLEESDELVPLLAAAGLQQIFLIAPTTSALRRQRMLERAAGFVYYVSFKGITGAAKLDQAGVAGELEQLRKLARTPLAVGFGIRDAASAVALAAHADAVVIGSALVETLAAATDVADACARARAFLEPIRQALDRAVSAAASD